MGSVVALAPRRHHELLASHCLLACLPRYFWVRSSHRKRFAGKSTRSLKIKAYVLQPEIWPAGAEPAEPGMKTMERGRQQRGIINQRSMNDLSPARRRVRGRGCTGSILSEPAQPEEMTRSNVQPAPNRSRSSASASTWKDTAPRRRPHQLYIFAAVLCIVVGADAFQLPPSNLVRRHIAFDKPTHYNNIYGAQPTAATARRRMSSTAEDTSTKKSSSDTSKSTTRHKHQSHIASTSHAGRSAKERMRSQARLDKARRMLDEFLLDPTGTFVEAQASGLMAKSVGKDGQSDIISSVGGTANDKSVKKRAAFGGTGARTMPTITQKRLQKEASKVVNGKTSAAPINGSMQMQGAPVEYSRDGKEIVLPDSFWYNGNLEGGSGDFVTRWQRGVKVAEPLRKYDPAVAEKVLFRQPNRWVIRNVQIALPLGAWAAGVVIDVVTGNEKRNRKSRAKQLLQTISGLGPAIIKAGQALSSRSDLLPREYLDELQNLQDNVPVFPNEKAFATVEEELGVEFGESFELIGTDPVAAASIGQVYKARLLSNGELVAIKIQRPKCEEIIALDLYVLRWWSNALWNRVASLLNRDIDFSSIIDDFGELIYREIDYVAEAANAQRFNELYSGVTDVFVPKVYSELTTSKVLTMEWVDGFRLTDIEMLEAYNLDRKKLVDTLVQCSLRQILDNGFFHADPHGGNLLACEDGRLCYLDFGMMSYAAAKQRNGFLLAVVHIVNRDWGELARLYVKLGFIPEDQDLRPIELALEDALPDVLSASVNELNFKNVVSKLGDIMYKYPFSLPPFYIAIIRCLGVLEGLAIQVDPSSRIISKAYPFIASRVLTDPQDELQEAFRRLAFTSDGHIRWSRLEGLLEEASETEDYDVSLALDLLSDYLISDDGEQLLNDLADQLVEGADSLGSETMAYVVDASRALLTNDEAGVANALQSLQTIIGKASTEEADRSVEGVSKEIRESLGKTLPEPTPSMQRFWRIALLLGARGSRTDPSKFVPLVRKLSQEPRVQRITSEIIARLGERALSRTLRAAFGLPPPEFEKEGSSQPKVAA